MYSGNKYVLNFYRIPSIMSLTRLQGDQIKHTSVYTHTHHKIHHTYLAPKAVLTRGITCSVPHVTLLRRAGISLSYSSVNREVPRVSGLSPVRDAVPSTREPVTRWFLTPVGCLGRYRWRWQREIAPSFSCSLSVTFPRKPGAPRDTVLG